MIYQVIEKYEHGNSIKIFCISYRNGDDLEKEIERWLDWHKECEVLVDLDNLKVFRSNGLIRMLEIVKYE